MKITLITGGNKGIGLEVAKAMLWLAESSEYINGTTIDVNNGSYMR